MLLLPLSSDSRLVLACLSKNSFLFVVFRCETDIKNSNLDWRLFSHSKSEIIIGRWTNVLMEGITWEKCENLEEESFRFFTVIFHKGKKPLGKFVVAERSHPRFFAIHSIQQSISNKNEDWKWWAASSKILFLQC